MAALSGTFEFSYQMNIRVHPLNLHKTFKNIFKWHPGKNTVGTIDIQHLAFFFHSDFCGSSDCSLSFSAQGLSLASRSYCAWADFLRVICNQWRINTPASSPLTWDYPESPSRIKFPLPTMVTGLKTCLLLTAFPISFLMIFSEIPFCISSNNYLQFHFGGAPK